MSAPPLDLGELPSVLALPLAEYRAESDPLLRLWHLCDCAELSLRTLVALSLADWLAAGKGELPAKLRAEIGSRIEQPTVGKWRGMVLALSRKAPKDSRVPGLYGFVTDHLDPLLRGATAEASIESSLLELRNRLAHGGGMSRALAARLCDLYAPRFDSVIDELAWLSAVAFVVPHERDGRGGRMVGPTTELRALSAEETRDLDRAREIAAQPGAVVALSGGEPLPLWPLVHYGVPAGSGAQMPATRPVPQIYARRGEVRLMLTPLGSDEVAMAESGQGAVAYLLGLVARPEKARETWEVAGFERELGRDASHVVGRRSELDLLARAAEREHGALWITGPAGIGKSYLMAKLALELGERAGEARLVLPFRFKVGDARCSRDQFLRFAVERVEAWADAKRGGGGRQSPLRRLGRLLEGLPAERTVVFVLDGLDEVATLDPGFAEEVPVALREEAVWVCSGQPERGLPEVFGPDRAHNVFPDGVPGMGAVDTRAMLLCKIGPLSKRLLAEDCDAGDEAVNPFVDRVVANAGGLPIYVAYVIGDVLSGRLRAFGEEAALPPSLEAYHAELLRGCAIGSVHQVLTPIVATLAVSREALGPEILGALLFRRGLTTRGAEGLAIVGGALAAAASLLRRASPEEGEAGSGGADAFTLFHLSLRDYMLGAAQTRVAIETARHSLADAAIAHPRSIASGDEAEPYLFRRGVAHLVDAKRASEAATLMSSFGYLMARTEHLGPTGTAMLIADLALVAARLDGEAAARFAPWRAFLTRRAHLLERGGAIALLQAAIAEADASPITAAAESWVAEGRARSVAWLRRIDRPESSGPEQCVRTLEGHASRVTDVVVHPDGGRAISAAGDASLKVWDLETGECVRTLQERQDSMSFAMVTAVPMASCLREFSGHGWTVWSLALLSGGRRVAAAHGDRTIKIWDVESGSCLRSLTGHEGYVWSVAAHPDGRRLLSAGDDRSLRVWDADTGTCEKVMSGHEDWVATAVITPDGRGAVSAGGEGTLRLWDLESGRCLRTLAGHRDYVSQVALAADGRLAYSASGDGTLARWDLPGGRCAKRWEAHPGGAWSVALAERDRKLLSGGRDGVIHLWDAQSGEKLNTLRGHAGWVWRIAAVDEVRALSASADKALKLWNFDAAASARGRASHAGPIHDLAVSEDGRQAITAGADGTLKLWELSTGRSLRTFYGHEGDVRAVALTPDGRGAVSAGADRTVREWRLETGECVRTLVSSDEEVLALALARRGDMLLCGGRAGSLSVWDLDQGARVKNMPAHTGPIWALAVDADGRRGLSAGADGVALLWDLERGEIERTLRGHSWEVQAAAFVPDRLHAITTGRDKSIKVWELSSGRCTRTLARHSGTTHALALWPDGKCALSLAEDKTLELWSIAEETTIARWSAEAAITAVGVAAEQRIVLGDAAGQITYLELQS